MLSDYLVQHQGSIYTGSYFIALSIVAAWEAFSPRRALTQPMGLRWSANISLTFLNIFVARLLVPLMPVALALYANSRGFGVLQVFEIPTSVAVVIALVVLDAHTWTVHYLLHRVPLLWRLHRVHHSDPDYDFSTSLRFHPCEALFSVGVEALVILALGPPAIAVLIYKVVQVFMGAFAHGNLKLPTQVDGLLRKALVTPDLHRIHHSAHPRETNSNFGGITPWWDRLFATYIDQPAGGHEALEMGLHGMQTVESIHLHRMLLQPFARSQRRQTPSPSPFIAGTDRQP